MRKAIATRVNPAVWDRAWADTRAAEAEGHWRRETAYSICLENPKELSVSTIKGLRHVVHKSCKHWLLSKALEAGTPASFETL